MDKLRDDLERIRASAVKRGLTEAQIEQVLGERSEAVAKIEFERKKLTEHLFGLRCFTIAAITAPGFLWLGKIVASAMNLNNIELRDEWIIGIWALSLASGINYGYQLVKIGDYLPGLPWLKKPEVQYEELEDYSVDFTPDIDVDDQPGSSR